MRKPDTMDGSRTPSEWWKHLKYMKRAVHKAERKNWKNITKREMLEREERETGMISSGLFR